MSFLLPLICYRQSCLSLRIALLISLTFISALSLRSTDCDKLHCVYGSCVNGSCVCDQGWHGLNCEVCGGRQRLTANSGFITDGPGNYTSNSRCTWLIEPHEKNVTLVLRLEFFATECGRDLLYIRNGDSMQAPLLAVYSGVVFDEDINQKPELIATSGLAYLYFTSDDVYDMEGFNISYRVKSCNNNCLSARNNISTHKANCIGGHCNSEEHISKCHLNQKEGMNCSQIEKNDYWTVISSKILSKYGSASHQAFVFNDYMWIFGGYNFYTKLFQIFRYEFATSEWEPVNQEESKFKPKARYGHTVVEYKGLAYMYGGRLIQGDIVNEFWIFNCTNNIWQPVIHDKCNSEPCLPIPIIGHTANIINKRMLIIFGYNPIYGYLNVIQEYDIVQKKWQILNTTGAIVRGAFGHSSIYDPNTRMIFVYGGYRYLKSSAYEISNTLYAFLTPNNLWLLYAPGPSNRYLHSATVINKMMIIFGGNARNYPTRNGQNFCFSSDVHVYDIHCDYWHKLSSPNSKKFSIGRYGHSAVVFNGSIYIYGGFNGQMISNILVYTPGFCAGYNTYESCVKVESGKKCVWVNGTCKHLDSEDEIFKAKCFRRPDELGRLCESLKSCLSCLSSTYDCKWCEDLCSYENCSEKLQFSQADENINCDSGLANRCENLHSCNACVTLDDCVWNKPQGCKSREFSLGHVETVSEETCPLSCSERKTCVSCSDESCIWCETKKRCVNYNAFEISFLYGQCVEWIKSKHNCPVPRCSEMRTCKQCQENRTCGWCQKKHTNDGYCIEGIRSHLNPNVSFHDFLGRGKNCPTSDWYYEGCPACSCSGRGICNEMNGACICTTKGISGQNCEKCEEGYSFAGPKNEKTCFYGLTTGVEFSLNLSIPIDKYYTQMNFRNIIPVAEKGVELSMLFSDSVYINITAESDILQLSRVLISNYHGNHLKLNLSQLNFTMCGIEKVVYYIYVFRFKTPLWLQISFIRQISVEVATETTNPFIIVLSCCIVLFTVAGIIFWKIKLKYNTWWCRRCRMEDLATRPLATCSTESLDALSLTKTIHIKYSKPSI